MGSSTQAGNDYRRPRREDEGGDQHRQTQAIETLAVEMKGLRKDLRELIDAVNRMAHRFRGM